MSCGLIQVLAAWRLEPCETVCTRSRSNMVGAATDIAAVACAYTAEAVCDVGLVGPACNVPVVVGTRVWRRETARRIGRHWIIDRDPGALRDTGILSGEDGLVDHVSNTLTNIDSAQRVAVCHVTAKDRIHQIELDLVVAEGWDG